jgi:hypothetical protein
MKKHKIDSKMVDQCMQDSGGYTLDQTNTKLAGEIQYKDQLGVLIVPSIYVNSVVQRGGVTASSVFTMICNGFPDGTAPKVCAECNFSPDYDLDACVNTIYAPDGGGGGGDIDIPDVDFDDFANCLATFDNVHPDSLETCILDVALGLSIVRFISCTDWNIGDLIGDFSGASFAQFEKVIAECSDVSDMGMLNCFEALKGASDEDDNPLSLYLRDLFEDPAKYCGCNKDLYAALPAPCIFNLPGDSVDFDLGQVKLSSCLIGELCDEIARACHHLGNEFNTCLPDAHGITKSNCGTIIQQCLGQGIDESLFAVGTEVPPGCLSEFTHEVKHSVSKFESVCLSVDTGNDDVNTPGKVLTTSSFPPSVAITIAVVLFAGLAYVVSRKFTSARKKPQMQINFDDDGEMSMDGTGMHAGITMSTLHVGGKKKKGGFAQLGDDDEDNSDNKAGMSMG